jgi:hypothetical protein
MHVPENAICAPLGGSLWILGIRIAPETAIGSAAATAVLSLTIPFSIEPLKLTVVTLGATASPR